MAEGFGMIEKTLVCFAFQAPNTEKLAKGVAAVHDVTEITG